MTRKFKVLGTILLTLVAVAPVTQAQDQVAPTEVVKIKSITSSVLSDKTRIVLETSAPLSLPSSYNLDPLVLVLDVPGADATALQKQYVIGSPSVDKVNVYQLEEAGQKAITRLEIIMTSVVPYRIFSESGNLFVDFEHLEVSAVPGQGKTQEFFKKPEHPQAPAAPQKSKQEAAPQRPTALASTEAARIQNIDIKKDDGQLSVLVDYQGKVEVKYFELKAPKRLVLDLINAVNAVPVDTISVKFDPVESIRIGQFQSTQPKIARVVFDLNSEPQYRVVASDTRLTIVFGTRGAVEGAQGAVKDSIPQASEQSQAAQVVPEPTAAQSIEESPAPVAPEAGEAESGAPAEQNAESSSIPEVVTPDQAPVETVQQEPSSEIGAQAQNAPIESGPTMLVASVEKPEAPATGVASAETADAAPAHPGRHRSGKKGIEMAQVPAPLQLNEEKPAGEPPPAAPLATTGTRFEAQTITPGETTYSGEPINLDLVDAPIEQVFRLISEISGLNVITDPGVTGRVTVHFRGVPWDQALDLILKTNGLGYVLENRVVRISKLEVLAQEEQKKRALREAKLLSVELKTITRSLSYAKVADMEPVLKKMLSQRGEIITDARTNTVIVSDIPEKVAAIDKLIESLDTATPQVTIQAKIVESTSNYTQNLGIQWGFQGIADARHGNQTTLQFPNNIVVDGGAVGGTTGLIGPLGGYAVNLPAPAFNSGIGISIGNVLDTFRLDAALTALESSGRGRILSAPKVTTQNNVKASIIQGREIPVQTTANNTTTTTFKNAALELNVTPQITAEGTIIMLVDIKNDQADFANLVNGIPPIITQKAQTTVLVRDGGTSVIGGIYRAEDSFTEGKVPGLHKIPLLGYLFKNSQKTRSNRELLIFLTPRIVRE
ncbi:MAG: type IV pilus secretin PilQ [Acidobacteria bacterium]|nr:type IV pilus secretin PilQ [Acidobacteriota bacterium]